MKKIIFLALLFLALPVVAKAYCSDTEMIRLQKISRNINSSYNYNETTGKFQITLTNLKKELEVYDLYDEKSYNVDGELIFDGLYSGKHTYIIYDKERTCTEYELITINVELPYYNNYYNNEECKGIENYSYCSKWVKSIIPNEIWTAKVKAYKDTLKNEETKKQKNPSFLQSILENYMQYYYIVLPIIIVVFGIAIIIRNRKDQLI